MTCKPTYMKVLFILLSAIMFLGVLAPKKVYADTEPKPSVTVTVKNFGTECYGTVLSKKDSYGPWSVDNPLMVSNREVDLESTNASNAIKEFVENNDDYYYLNNLYYMNCEKNNFSWTYYVPNDFKILIYYPETGIISITNPMTRYAFNSYYVVDGDLVKEDKLRLNGTYRGDGLEILFRVFLTISIELFIAIVFFKYSNGKSIGYLFSINVVTQFILNIVVDKVIYPKETFGAIGVIIFGELIVFTIEMILDSMYLPRLSGDTKEGAKRKALFYGFIANLSSLILGEIIVKAFYQVLINA